MYARVRYMTILAIVALTQTGLALDVPWAPMASESEYLLDVPNLYNAGGVEHSWADTPFRDPGQRSLAAFRTEMAQAGRYGGGLNWDSLPVGAEVASGAGMALDIQGLPFAIRIHSTTNGKSIKVIEWELPPANPTASGAVSGTRFLGALDARDPQEWMLEFDVPADYALRGFGVVLTNSGWNNGSASIVFYHGDTPIAEFGWADGVWFPDHSTDDNFVGYWSSEAITAVQIIADENVVLGRLDDLGLILVPKPKTATALYPQDGDVNVPQDVTLVWSAGYKAAQHAVYFGADKTAVAEATAASTGLYHGVQALEETSFPPGPLDWNKTYYWRIDEVNEAGAAGLSKGSVWSFTTANFLVIDDFEGYGDEEGSRIYETWIDGWINGTCSQVGNLLMPFAERTIIHEGRQSMPVDYNNVKPPFYSEAVRTWDTPQDWTVHEVSTLTLYFRGSVGNQAAPLYVGIEDSSRHLAVKTYPDNTALAATQWTAWKIPLRDFSTAGVRLTAIKKLYLGVGDRGNPVAGGSGRLYLDDIRVTKPD